MPYLFIWMKTFSSFLCKSPFKFISHLVQRYLFSKCALGPHFGCTCEIVFTCRHKTHLSCSSRNDFWKRVGVDNLRFHSWVMCESCKWLCSLYSAFPAGCSLAFRLLADGGTEAKANPFKLVWVCDLASTPSPSHPPLESWGRLIPEERITHMQLVSGFFSHLFQSFRRKRCKQTKAVLSPPHQENYHV